MTHPDWLDLFDTAALLALVLFVMYTIDSARFLRHTWEATNHESRRSAKPNNRARP